MERKEYRVISEFYCYGKQMVTVIIRESAHVMTKEEWRLVYGRNHQNRWGVDVDWNRFNPKGKYHKEKVS